MTANFQCGTFDKPSWHKGERNFEAIVDGDTVTGAMGKARMLDIEAINAPVYFEVGGQMIKGDKSQLVLTNVPWTVNGIQSLERLVKRYTAVQNSQYASILDPLTQYYPVKGVAQIGTMGQVMVIQLGMGTFEIGGFEQEAHESYLLVSDDRLGGLKMWGSVITRVVCENTYNAAKGEKGDKSLPSGKHSFEVASFRAMIEQKAVENRRDHITALNHLFTRKISDNVVDELCSQLFPIPQVPKMVQLRDMGTELNGDDHNVQTVTKDGDRAFQLWQNAIDRNARYTQAIKDGYARFNDEFSYAGGTAYALWEATTQFANGHTGQFESDNDAYNLLFGEKAKLQSAAFAYLTK